MCMYVCMYVYVQGRIQDLWKGGGGGRSGYRERHRREGFWRVPFEDPLWDFKRGGARAPCAPPPESASDVCMYMYVCMCMDGWMDGRMDGWIREDGWVAGWQGGWVAGCWVGGCMAGWLDAGWLDAGWLGLLGTRSWSGRVVCVLPE